VTRFCRESARDSTGTSERASGEHGGRRRDSDHSPVDGIRGMLNEVLKASLPTMLFAAPYSGHEWTSFATVMKSKEGRCSIAS